MVDARLLWLCTRKRKGGVRRGEEGGGGVRWGEEG